MVFIGATSLYFTRSVFADVQYGAHAGTACIILFNFYNALIRSALPDILMCNSLKKINSKI